jgi:type 1 glutamine amidotransferase
VAGLPATFKLSDELYHVEVDPKGSTMEVLAEGRNPATGATYPLIWIVNRPKSRIVCCTLGHDGKSHDLAPYKTFIQNCVKWAAEK